MNFSHVAVYVTTDTMLFIIEATITRQQLPPVSRGGLYAHFSDWLVGNISTSFLQTENSSRQVIFLVV